MIQNRQKWFNIKCNLTFDSLIKKLNSFPYKEDNQIGFDVLEIQPRMIFARYIECQNIIEELHHPFGGVEKVSSIKYIIFKFEIVPLNGDNFLIKVINPPGSLKGFVKTLYGLLQDDFFISKVRIDVEDCFSSLIKSSSTRRYSVEQLLVSSIPFGKKTVATIRLKSTDNAYSEFKKRHTGKKYKIEKIGVMLRFNAEWERVVISSSGLIACTSGLDRVVEKYVEEAQLAATPTVR
jgi:hypothetical protein